MRSLFNLLRGMIWFILAITISVSFMGLYIHFMLWLLPKIYAGLIQLGVVWGAIVLLIAGGLVFNPIGKIVEGIGYYFTGSAIYLCSWLYPNTFPSIALLKFAIGITVIPVALLLLTITQERALLLSLPLYLASLTVYISASYFTFISALSAGVLPYIANGRFIKAYKA